MSDAAGTLWLDVGRRRWSDAAAARHRARSAPHAAPGRRQRGQRGCSRRNSRSAGAWRRTSWSPAAPATTPRARSASARSRRAMPSCRSAPRACCSASPTAFAPAPAAAVHAFCHALPGTLAPDGRDAVGRRHRSPGSRGVTGDAGGRRCSRRSASASTGRARSSSCPISTASARRTTTPPRAAPSSACAARPDATQIVQAVLEGVAFAFARQSRGAERRRRARSREVDRRRRRLALGAVGADHRRRARHSRRTARGRRGRRARSARRGSAGSPPPAPTRREVCTPSAPARDLRPRRVARVPPTTTPIAQLARSSIPRSKECPAVNASREFLRCNRAGRLSTARMRQTRSPSAGTTRTGSCSASGMEDHLRFAVCYWHTFGWPGGDPFGGETSCGPGITAPIRWRWRAPRPTSPSSSSACSACRSSPSTTSTSRPKARRSPRCDANLDAIADIFDEKMAASRRQAAVGHGQPVLATAATWRARRPIPIPMSSPMPPRR